MSNLYLNISTSLPLWSLDLDWYLLRSLFFGQMRQNVQLPHYLHLFGTIEIAVEGIRSFLPNLQALLFALALFDLLFMLDQNLAVLFTTEHDHWKIYPILLFFYAGRFHIFIDQLFAFFNLSLQVLMKLFLSHD